MPKNYSFFSPETLVIMGKGRSKEYERELNLYYFNHLNEYAGRAFADMYDQSKFFQSSLDDYLSAKSNNNTKYQDLSDQVQLFSDLTRVMYKLFVRSAQNNHNILVKNNLESNPEKLDFDHKISLQSEARKSVYEFIKDMTEKINNYANLYPKYKPRFKSEISAAIKQVESVLSKNVTNPSEEELKVLKDRLESQRFEKMKWSLEQEMTKFDAIRAEQIANSSQTKSKFLDFNSLIPLSGDEAKMREAKTLYANKIAQEKYIILMRELVEKINKNPNSEASKHNKKLLALYRFIHSELDMEFLEHSIEYSKKYNSDYLKDCCFYHIGIRSDVSTKLENTHKAYAKEEGKRSYPDLSVLLNNLKITPASTEFMQDVNPSFFKGLIEYVNHHTGLIFDSNFNNIKEQFAKLRSEIGNVTPANLDSTLPKAPTSPIKGYGSEPLSSKNPSNDTSPSQIRDSEKQHDTQKSQNSSDVDVDLEKDLAGISLSGALNSSLRENSAENKAQRQIQNSKNPDDTQQRQNLPVVGNLEEDLADISLNDALNSSPRNNSAENTAPSRIQDSETQHDTQQRPNGLTSSQPDFLASLINSASIYGQYLWTKFVSGYAEYFSPYISWSSRESELVAPSSDEIGR